MFERSDSRGRARAVLLGLALVAGCQGVDHPPPLTFPSRSELGSGGESGAGAPTVVIPGGSSDPTPAPPAGSTACGGVRIPAVVDRPNLYFVIDRSGSMADAITRVSSTSKYAAARQAIASVLRAMGHRVRYGAMVFPDSLSGNSACDAGRETYPLTQGDPRGDRNPELNGPNLRLLLTRLLSYSPAGGTPTAASLAKAHQRLSKEPGRSFIVLATDGAPNCNFDLVTCSSERCIPDLEHAVLMSSPPLVCGRDLSCCEEGVLADPGPTLCMDDEATLAEVKALSAASISTYVIGMPGSEAYARVLATWARAGGTARGETGYYAVGDEAELTDALFEIGAGLSIGCEIDLDSEPEDRALVNLYFDQALVAQDVENGWTWAGSERTTTQGGATVVLRGEACAALKSGDIADVELVYGCRTVVR